MVKQLIFLIFIFCTLTGTSGLSYADEKDPAEAVEYLVSATGRYYDEGDLLGAIEDLEEGYKLDPLNGRIRHYLSYFLTKRSRQYCNKKDYDSALDCLERAVDLNPNNKIAKEYYKLLSSGVTELPAEERIRPRKVKKRPKTYAPKETLPKKLKKIIKKGELPGEEIPSGSVIDDVLSATKLDRVPRAYLLYGIIGFLSFLVMLLFVGGAISLGRVKKHDQMFEQRMNIILNQLQNPAEALSKGKMQLVPYNIAQLEQKGEISVSEMLKDDNPRVRGRAIELMENDLKDEDSVIVESLLKPYFDDPSNRVRANAIKAFYPHNPKKSLALLKEMLSSEDKWMRTSAIWVIGEVVKPKEAQKILTPYLNDPDYYVRKRLLKTLKKVKSG